MHVFSYSAEVLGLSRGTFDNSSETLKIININFFYAFIIQMVQLINTGKNQVMFTLMNFLVQEIGLY